jgi:hypothetical protein
MPTTGAAGANRFGDLHLQLYALMTRRQSGTLADGDFQR